jgi:hypothetical protein
MPAISGFSGSRQHGVATVDLVVTKGTSRLLMAEEPRRLTHEGRCQVGFHHCPALAERSETSGRAPRLRQRQASREQGTCAARQRGVTVTQGAARQPPAHPFGLMRPPFPSQVKWVITHQGRDVWVKRYGTYSTYLPAWYATTPGQPSYTRTFCCLLLGSEKCDKSRRQKAHPGCGDVGEVHPWCVHGRPARYSWVQPAGGLAFWTFRSCGRGLQVTPVESLIPPGCPGSPQVP